MQIRATVRYLCYTCGELIVNEDNSPDMAGVLFLNSDFEEVVPPFPADTTTHHARHIEEPS